MKATLGAWGTRVEGLGFRAFGFRFRVKGTWGLGLRGLRVWGTRV